ncbi:MAG: carbon storage regulator [Planctomycetota bacterium]
MLVLTRKVSQRIQVGEDITITVVKIDGNKVRIGIEAPRGVSVMREELLDHELVGAHALEELIPC